MKLSTIGLSLVGFFRVLTDRYNAAHYCGCRFDYTGFNNRGGDCGEGDKIPANATRNSKNSKLVLDIIDTIPPDRLAKFAKLA